MMVHSSLTASLPGTVMLGTALTAKRSRNAGHAIGMETQQASAAISQNTTENWVPNCLSKVCITSQAGIVTWTLIENPRPNFLTFGDKQVQQRQEKGVALAHCQLR